MLERPLIFDLTMLYAPEVYLPPDRSEAERFVQQLVDWTKQQRRAIFFKLEVTNLHDQSPLGLAEFGFQPSFEEIQPTWRQQVSLVGSAEAILGQMKEKGRYNVRLAEKQGVTVRLHDELMFVEEDAHIFYRLYLETARRQHFEPRGFSYMRALLELLYKQKWGALVVASFDEQPLSALIVSWYEGAALYLYGASSELKREVMAPYLAHYQAMLEAKKHGATSYDLLAVDPPSGLGPLPKKYAGLGQFKRQFGGQTVAIVGGFDLVLKPTWYKLYRFAEKMRRRI